MNTKTLMIEKIALLLASITLVPLTHAATWPEKPVRVIIPWAPGGSTDIVGRLVASELGNRLKQQVIIDNRSGAGGIVGMQIASQSPPDGYTLLITSTAYGYLINKSSKVDLVTTFTPVVLLGLGDAALTVSPKLPVKSVKELIALAKAKPGQLLYASSGIGGFPHMNTELLNLKAGVKITHVPFRGGGPAAADVMAGNTHLYLGSLTTVMSHIDAGRLKLLAVGGSKRNPQVPDVPTISEAVPDYESYIWWGLFAPTRTPAAVISRVHAEVSAALKSPEILKKLDAQGAVPRHMSTAEFRDFMKAGTEKWSEVIKAAGIEEQ